LNKVKIISFINYKGGVGRTTIILNFAKTLASKNFKVLCIDLDPKACLTNSLLLKHSVTNNLYDLFNEDNLDIKSILQDTEQGFFIAPAGANMDNLEYSLNTSQDFIPHKRLKNILKKIEDFDYILIDTPPFPSMININAILVASYIIVPITLDYYCFYATDLLFNTFNNINSTILDKVLFLVNKYDKREIINEEVLKAYKEKYFKQYFFRTRIKANSKYKLLINRQKTIFDLEPPRGKGVQDFYNFCEEFLILEKGFMQFENKINSF